MINKLLISKANILFIYFALKEIERWAYFYSFVYIVSTKCSYTATPI